MCECECACECECECAYECACECARVHVGKGHDGDSALGRKVLEPHLVCRYWCVHAHVHVHVHVHVYVCAAAKDIERGR